MAISAASFISQFPTEVFFIAALWLVAAAYAFKSGVSRINALALALVTSGLLFTYLPVTWPFASATAIEIASDWSSSVIVFAVLALVMIFVMRRIGVDAYMDSGRPAASALAAAAFVAVALALWAHIPALYTFYGFSALLAPFFSAQYFFWWLAGSLGLLAALSQNRAW